MRYIIYSIVISVVFGVGVLVGKQLGFDEIKSKQPNLYNFKSHNDKLKVGDYWITYPGGNPGLEYSISIYKEDGWNRILYRNGDGELYIHHCSSLRGAGVNY